MTDDLAQRVRHAVEGLTPGYFALVMASGIISIGLFLDGYIALSVLLLAVCVVSFLTLGALTAWRLLAYRDVVGDFTDPRRGFGFFTFVADTKVLGARVAMDGHHTLTAALLVAAGLTWLVLGYVILWTAVLGRQQRPVVATANGTWFIWVVASQSVAISAATIEPVFASLTDELAVVAVFSWSVGIVLYVAAGIFVSAQMMLYELRPVDLDPPYWVAMGASAITVLAGARIVEMADAPMVNATRGLIAGASVSMERPARSASRVDRPLWQRKVPHTEGAGRHDQYEGPGVIHLGLAVHKNTISVGILEPGADSPRTDRISSDPDAVCHLIDRFEDPARLRAWATRPAPPGMSWLASCARWGCRAR